MIAMLAFCARLFGIFFREKLGCISDRSAHARQISGKLFLGNRRAKGDVNLQVNSGRPCVRVDKGSYRLSAVAVVRAVVIAGAGWWGLLKLYEEKNMILAWGIGLYD